jgi:hypothetical protein
MASRVRTLLREYFDSVNKKKFCKETLDFYYLRELSHYFFKLIHGKNKTIKKTEKYAAQNDWGLYKAQELCDLIETKKL